ncbi:competence protein ComK [Gemella sp. zg-1178]|uniref:competence protein ComK n=1 Tax=Gemella sp. zg-1178 TaxID=2840372 RepID=UPI001C03C797|nr:competence protein ComK [Gemella sp. zg-1178]MBU0278937.1 competence protein ComK [Gemella sp. zg-1178]
MEYFKSKDIVVLIKKYEIMAIDCFYDEMGALISKLYCLDNNEILVDIKPSKIINTICEIYNNDDYISCSKKTKKIILCDKKIPVFINDDYGSIWLPFGTTNNDTDGSFWLNMNYISINPHTAKADKKTKRLTLILEDGQKLELDINYKNFMLKWGEGAALKYEIDKSKRRIIAQNHFNY